MWRLPCEIPDSQTARHNSLVLFPRSEWTSSPQPTANSQRLSEEPQGLLHPWDESAPGLGRAGPSRTRPDKVIHSLAEQMRMAAVLKENSTQKPLFNMLVHYLMLQNNFTSLTRNMQYFIPQQRNVQNPTSNNDATLGIMPPPLLYWSEWIQKI